MMTVVHLTQKNQNYETATKLLLSPGVAQVYYGDESAL
jgi:hypothetical protein